MSVITDIYKYTNIKNFTFSLYHRLEHNYTIISNKMSNNHYLQQMIIKIIVHQLHLHDMWVY